MASPSQACKWSRTTTTIKPSSSSSLFNPSIFFSFHTTPPKRPRIFSLHHSSSSSYSKPKQRLTKSVDSDDSTSQPNTLSASPNSRSKTRSPLSFKSLSGKRSLWRRIFFASKKLRSIILLNVITLVYGNFAPFFSVWFLRK